MDTPIAVPFFLPPVARRELATTAAAVQEALAVVAAADPAMDVILRQPEDGFGALDLVPRLTVDATGGFALIVSRVPQLDQAPAAERRVDIVFEHDEVAVRGADEASAHLAAYRAGELLEALAGALTVVAPDVRRAARVHRTAAALSELTADEYERRRQQLVAQAPDGATGLRALLGATR